MTNFNKNLKNALNKKPKTEVRDRLRKKIQAKQNLRNTKQQTKIQVSKMRENFKLNDNKDIRDVSIVLMMEVDRLTKQGITSIPALDRAFNGKFDFFKKSYFGIYRAILAKELPIDVLDMMIAHKSKVDNKEITVEKASLQVGDIISKKLNVDVEALTKSVEKMRMDEQKTE